VPARLFGEKPSGGQLELLNCFDINDDFIVLD
jgi:hypothetical protein